MPTQSYCRPCTPARVYPIEFTPNAAFWPSVSANEGLAGTTMNDVTGLPYHFGAKRPDQLENRSGTNGLRGERKMKRIIHRAFKEAERRNGGKIVRSEREWFGFWRRYDGQGIGQIEDKLGDWRAGNEVWGVLSVLWMVMRNYTGETGLAAGRFSVEDLGLLCMMQRIADAGGDSVFHHSIVRAYADGYSGLTWKKTSMAIKRLQRMGLVERMPVMMAKGKYKVWTYRLSEGGKRLLAGLVKDIEKAHRDIHAIVRETPEYSVLLKYMVDKFCLGIDVGPMAHPPGETPPDTDLTGMYDFDLDALKGKGKKKP